MGLTREVVSHMQTPQGDFACLFHEGEDLAKSFQTAATSDDPHDQWFREKIQAIHGITAEVLQGPLPRPFTMTSRPADLRRRAVPAPVALPAARRLAAALQGFPKVAGLEV
jgi:hypothetical protein